MNARTRLAIPTAVLAGPGPARLRGPCTRPCAGRPSSTASGERLTELVGQRPDGVDYPDALDGVVGATMVCLLTDSGQSYPETLRVIGVDGHRVDFDFQVAEPRCRENGPGGRRRGPSPPATPG